MDESTRNELEKIHGRVNDLNGRVVNLEAQQPHINAALVRIQGSVDRIADRIGKAMWALFGMFAIPFVGLVVALLFKLAISGALSRFAG